MPELARPRAYWRRLLRFAGLCLAAVVLAGLLAAGGWVLRWAELMTHPPRLPLERSPADVGIESYQEVALVTGDGLTLRGWYVPSRNRAAVILGHGHASNRASLLPEAGLLARAGFGLLLLDWRAHGQSDGDMVTFGCREKQDLLAALDFVSARPDVDPDRIGLLGFSMGGAVMIEGAAVDPRPRAVLVESTYATLEEELAWQMGGLPGGALLARLWGQMRTGIEPDAVRPVDRIGQISPRPVLLIYGAEDGVVPPGSAQRLYAAAGEPKELWVIEGCGHGGFAQAAPAYEGRLVDFFKQLLR
ncbi:MAG: alpha/beta fold hydrolase [Chloroflexia bacterium]|nr:alpha/beta fold hydrolase [Chloroflexia bacterium]